MQKKKAESDSLQNIIVSNHNLYFRDFPWRHDISPYRIMIAEFMLHRTRAEQVSSIYIKFIKDYPDVFELSKVSDEEISIVTRHLGLHWRHSHFKRAAKYIVNEYGGKIPDSRKELLKIPGIGEYASGAISAVCFKKKEYIIDANIARFINRFYGLNLEGEIRRKRAIKERAIKLFNHEDPDKLLFALLDFTALICKNKKPLCEKCVLRDKCARSCQKSSIS